MADPGGNWDKFRGVSEFDLYDSRKIGWHLDICFAQSDPLDGVDRLEVELDGNNPYTSPHYGREPAHIYRFLHPQEWASWQEGKGAVPAGHGKYRYSYILGVLPAPDAPLAALSPIIRKGTFLVLGNQDGTERRRFWFPIISITQWYVDRGL